MREPSTNRPSQLIVIGGTLSCKLNAAGRLVPVQFAKPGPSDDPGQPSLYNCIKNAGFDVDDPHCLVDPPPFFIDSIKFDMREHGKQLLRAVRKSLDAGYNPIIAGGTDSLAWYSTLLIKDLKRHKDTHGEYYLSPGSGQKVTFLSAMKSLSDKGGPQHITNIFRAGKTFAEQADLTGGFAISAEYDKGHRLVAHDVLNDFDKVSAEQVYAFRSKLPAGYIIGPEDALPGTTKDWQFEKNERYHPPEEKKPEREVATYLRIAPPLMMGQGGDAILHSLQALGAVMPAYDGIIIEGVPKDFPHKQSWLGKVRALTQRGTRVVFCNPVRYLDHEMKPFFAEDNQRWLKEAGAEFVTAMPKDLYIDMMLASKQEKGEPRKPLPAPVSTAKHFKVLGLRYAPDMGPMNEAVAALAPAAGSMVVCALPGGNIPPDACTAIQEAKRHSKKDFYGVFDYDSMEFVGMDGVVRREGDNAIHEYEAGALSRTLLKPLKCTDPDGTERLCSGPEAIREVECQGRRRPNPYTEYVERMRPLGGVPDRN